MTSPLNAILAGLGRGASTLGESLDARDLLKQQRQRQAAQDALVRLKELDQMGAVPDTGQPTAGDFTGVDTSGGLGPLKALAQANQASQGARRFQLPNAQTGGMDSFRIDESETPEAKGMKRLMAQQAGQQTLDRQKAQEAHDRQIEIEKLKLSGIQETFGTPYAAVGADGKPKMFERGNRGTIREIPGQTPYSKPEVPNYSPLVTTGADGRQVVTPFETHSGTVKAPIANAKGGVGGTGALAAPIAAKVGQFGEMLKKADDLFQLTDGLSVSLGNSAARDISEHGVGIGSARIPGTKGIGSLMMNNDSRYTQYQAALSPFILAAAHALSGARINQDQVEQIRKSVEVAPGDFGNPNVHAQKQKNLIDLINSIGGSLPAAAIAQQEEQMAGPGIERVTSRGYQRAKVAETAPPPTRRAGDAKPSLTDRIAELKAQGVSKEQAKATLKAEGYTVP